MKNLFHLKLGDKSFLLNLDNLNVIDGFIPLLACEEKENDMLEVTTGVIDTKFKLRVPLRTKLVSKEEYYAYNFDNDVSVYKNKKAIYRVSESEFYLIDLENTIFESRREDIIPVNYMAYLLYKEQVRWAFLLEVRTPFRYSL